MAPQKIVIYLTLIYDFTFFKKKFFKFTVNCTNNQRRNNIHFIKYKMFFVLMLNLKNLFLTYYEVPFQSGLRHTKSIN